MTLELIVGINLSQRQYVMAAMYLVYTKIEAHLKTLCYKRNNPNKHVGWYKANKGTLQIGVKKREH